MSQKLSSFAIVVFLIALAFYTRFVGINWGLPYPMHPDERNMIDAISKLSCAGINMSCLHPNFFAYGQLPLYLAYFINLVVTKLTISVTSFSNFAIILRFISGLSSCLMILVLLRSVNIIHKLGKLSLLYVGALIVLVPAFIQFSHFGTTESLLMLLLSILMYLAVSYLKARIGTKKFSILSGLIFGIATSIKLSSIIFIVVPGIALIMILISSSWRQKIRDILIFIFLFTGFSILSYIISSPYNALDFKQFLGSMFYESGVGTGEYKVFYTRQFEYSIPILFHAVSIFPYALGAPIFSLYILAFLFLPWDKVNNLLRITWIILFISSSLLFAKWTRFSAHLYPVMILTVSLFLVELERSLRRHVHFFGKYKLLRIIIIGFIVFVSSLPGLAYIAIYQNEDVRFTASRYIDKNIENGSHILSETANVVDIPITIPNEKPTSRAVSPYSFNFYELDQNPVLRRELTSLRSRSLYVFVPSRRIYANHTCFAPVRDSIVPTRGGISQVLGGYFPSRCQKLLEDYPQTNAYYQNLFGSGKYELIKTIANYPKIVIFGKTIFEMPDEGAEETWTVFDHPVIRIYKKVI